MVFPFKVRHPQAADLRSRQMVIGLGAMKCGTTWLSDYLAGHPDFFHAPIKEMNFFNQRWDNPFSGDGAPFRLYRMEEIILDRHFPRSAKLRQRLQALAQMGRLETVEDYLGFYARRMGAQGHFGEISPSYAMLPPDALREIARVTADVRFLFLMRDPAARMVSNIQHVRRRVRAQDSVDAIIADLTPDSPMWLRGDYGRTMDAIDAAGATDRCKFIIYEDLFRPETIRDLCEWLGLGFVQPDFGKKLNVAQSEPLSSAQKSAVREKLEPVYRDLAARFGADRPAKWQWS